MENKYINRYKAFCRSLNNLKKSKTADPDADFVLEGTVQNYNLTFDLSWKVMKDILVKLLGIDDIALGSPRANLQAAFSNGLIDDDVWLQMLKTRTVDLLLFLFYRFFLIFIGASKEIWKSYFFCS